MRIFSRCLVVMAIVAMAFFPAWSQTTADSLGAIDRLSKEIMAANPEYPDPYAVPVGALIRVPNPGGMDAFYRTEPWQKGQMGCFWHIAGFHLFGKRMTPPEPAPAVVPAAVAPTAFQKFWNAIPWGLILLLAASAVALGVYLKHREKKHLAHRMDYRNDPPVVAGGLSDDPAEALRQIQAADTLYHEPGRQVTGARHGEIRSRNGHNRVALRVEHTGPMGLDSADRWINNGDRCTEVTVSTNGGEPTIEYWLRHCGNRFGEIRDGQFQMPEGWEFVPTMQAAAHTVPTTQAAPETASAHVEHTSRNNGQARGDKFVAKVVITNNGGANPTTKQTIEVTADRFVTAMALPDGSKITF